MSSVFSRARWFQFFAREIWVPDLARLPFHRRLPLRVGRVAYLTVRGFRQDGCFLRASALTYITVLSVVPFLALTFSVIKSAGFYDHLRQTSIQPFLDRTLGPAMGVVVPGGQLRSAVDKLLELVDRTDVANLGLFGFLVLVYAVLRLLGAVEDSFNVIWGAGRSRSWPRKIADYLTIVLLAPVFFLAVATLTTAAQSAPLTGFLAEKLHLGEARDEFLRWSPQLAVWVGFTFFYIALPNARIRKLSALLGGVMAGTVWQLALVIHINSQIGIAKYNAVYSTFAALPVFLFWVYVSWVIVLFGAELAAADQTEPAYRQIALYRPTDHAFRSVVALRAVTRIARGFLGGAPPLRPSALADELQLPVRMVNESLTGLVNQGLIARSTGLPEETYLLARDPERIRVSDVLDALRGTAGPAEVPSASSADRKIDDALEALDETVRNSPHNRTLRELVEETEGSGAE